MEKTALDVSGFTKNYTEKYYVIIRRKERKIYVKNHISVDVERRLILHFAAPRGPRFDTRFAVAATRNMNKDNPKYILLYGQYDTEPSKKCINKESKIENQIPLKTISNEHYQLKNKNKFNQ